MDIPNKIKAIILMALLETALERKKALEEDEQEEAGNKVTPEPDESCCGEKLQFEPEICSGISHSRGETGTQVTKLADASVDTKIHALYALTPILQDTAVGKTAAKKVSEIIESL